VTSAKRSAASPDTPTLHEAESISNRRSVGLALPARRPTIAKIQADVKRAAADAGVRERLISLAANPSRIHPTNLPPSQSREQYAKVIRDGNIAGPIETLRVPRRYPARLPRCCPLSSSR
jgi:tripartite-type tricarboxylate transporter receptor subunit TctC